MTNKLLLRSVNLWSLGVLFVLTACYGENSDEQRNNLSKLASVSIGKVDVEWQRLNVKVYTKDQSDPVMNEWISKSTTSDKSAIFSNQVVYGKYRFELSFYKDDSEESLSYQSCDDQKDKWFLLESAQETVSIEICTVKGEQIATTQDLTDINITATVRDVTEENEEDTQASPGNSERLSQKVVFASQIDDLDCTAAATKYEKKTEKWAHFYTFEGFSVAGSTASCIWKGEFKIPARYRVKTHPWISADFSSKLASGTFLLGQAIARLDLRYKSEKEGVFENTQGFDFNAEVGIGQEWLKKTATHSFTKDLLPDNCKEDDRKYLVSMEVNLSASSASFLLPESELRLDYLQVKGFELEPCDAE